MTLKKILLILVLAGTAMVIADAVVTPAMSGAVGYIVCLYLLYMYTYKL